MVDSSGSLAPAALIPFCAYQVNMTLVGHDRRDLPFTICSKFKPTVLNGQLCYSLDLSLLKTENTQAGKRHGLVLILDQGEGKNSARKNEGFRETTRIPLDLESSGIEKRSAKIYLNTLSSYTDSKAGSFAMTALKKMAGTESFLKQTDKEKKCRIQTMESCQAQLYVDKVQTKCGCVPWTLSSALALKVCHSLSKYWIK